MTSLMIAAAETKVLEYIVENNLELNLYDEDERDEMIQMLFNSDTEFYGYGDISDYLGDGSLSQKLRTMQEFMNMYNDYMDENDSEKSLNLVDIMNMCWYICGTNITLEKMNEYVEQMKMENEEMIEKVLNRTK